MREIFLFGEIKATQGEITEICFLGSIRFTQNAVRMSALRSLTNRLTSEIRVLDE
jgi:hypothetical protein